jgi:hypothetical protein
MTRPRLSLAQRADLVRLWKLSGLSAYAFAKQHGFSPANLPRWAALLDASSPPPPDSLSFVRLLASPRALVVEVGSVRVRVEQGFDPALLRAVVAALVEGVTS